MLRIQREPTPFRDADDPNAHRANPPSPSSYVDPFDMSRQAQGNTFFPSGKTKLNALKKGFNYGRIKLPDMEDPSLETAWRQTLLQFLLWFVVGLLGLLGIGAWGIQWLADHTPNHVRVGFEKAIASVFEDELKENTVQPQAYTPAQQQAMIRLNQLLKVLQAKELQDDKRYPLQITIVLQKAPYPNAFAVPGGKMIITTGLLRLAKRLKHYEHDALGFILAHELGHFRHRDHLKGLGWKLFTLCVLIPLQATESIGLMSNNQYSQWQETAADEYALALVQRNAMNPDAGIAFFQAMAQTSPPEDWSDHILSDHPPTKARIQHLTHRKEVYLKLKSPKQLQIALLEALR
jgi:hypothetical protein